MCQGCEDFREYDRAIDAYLADELPKMMAQTVDTSVLWGSNVKVTDDALQSPGLDVLAEVATQPVQDHLRP